MANTFKVLSRSRATISASTVYTVPSATTTLVNNIIVANESTDVASYSINFNNLTVAASVQLDGNDAAILDIKQVLSSGETIGTFASASTVIFHVSGLEIN